MKLLLVFASLALHPMLIGAAEAVSWGPVANGLRLGVATASSSPGKLHLVFQNVGAAEIDVLLGGRTGIGPMYAMKFTVTGPNGDEHYLGYFGGANFVGGYIEPILVRLAPKETYDLLLPLNKFVCVLNRKDVTLDTLLQKRYSISASLEVNAESAKWAVSNVAWRGPMQLWTGKAESGDFPPISAQ
jgi:hypothetical protein